MPYNLVSLRDRPMKVRVVIKSATKSTASRRISLCPQMFRLGLHSSQIKALAKSDNSSHSWLTFVWCSANQAARGYMLTLLERALHYRVHRQLVYFASYSSLTYSLLEQSSCISSAIITSAASYLLVVPV